MQEIHYHISWADSSLDWKAFGSEEEARSIAERLKKRNESYTIVERDENCERCRMFEAGIMA